VQAAGANAAYAASPAAEQQFVDLVNRERVASGQPPLAVHPDLRAVARNWTDMMIADGQACGASPLRHNPNAAEQYSSGRTRPAENVGCGESVTWLHQALMNSAGHRANILGDFDHIGVGVSTDIHGTMWVTQNFVKQPDPVPDAGAANPPTASRGSGGSGNVTTPPSGASASTPITAASDTATAVTSTSSSSTTSTSTTSTSTTSTTAPTAITSTTVAASAAVDAHDFTVVPGPAGVVDDNSVPSQPLAILLFSDPLLLGSARSEIAGRSHATLIIPSAAAPEPHRIADSGFDTQGGEQGPLLTSLPRVRTTLQRMHPQATIERTVGSDPGFLGADLPLCERPRLAISCSTDAQRHGVHYSASRWRDLSSTPATDVEDGEK
jgi:hypothetical protein